MRDPIERLDCDYLVVGAGVAGLRAAIELAPAGRVLVVAKDNLRESSSEYAQGGIAVALNDDDEVELHEQDTLQAGAGLCNREAVRVLVSEGPAAIQELIDWGAAFDREGSRLLFAREGAHSRSRVLHARGDSTGQEIARTLYHKAASMGRVAFRSFAAVYDLVLGENGAVCGALAWDRGSARAIYIRARAVLLATGGLGRVFAETTNPAVATGDGVAMAYRAGAEIRDIEFVQFHPTALRLTGAPSFLLSEALRGEGAVLRNAAGERFMASYHPMAELAPRDVVSRSMVREMRRTGADHVLLDLSHRPAGFVQGRFPRIYETCLRYGIDLEKQAAPVHPAAHYAMGGVGTDLDGRTGLGRLYAAGEVACNGVHGANRLASNSLLEGVVFGARAGRAMLGDTAPAGEVENHAGLEPPRFCAWGAGALRRLATEGCGIERSAAGLHRVLAELEGAAAREGGGESEGRFDVRNLAEVLRLIARGALAREESRGGHLREEYPDARVEFQKHSAQRLGQAAVAFVD